MLVPVVDIVNVAVEIVDAKVPLVVSKIMLAAAPLVLAAKTMAPLTSILLFETKIISVPFAGVMPPDW